MDLHHEKHKVRTQILLSSWECLLHHHQGPPPPWPTPGRCPGPGLWGTVSTVRRRRSKAGPRSPFQKIWAGTHLSWNLSQVSLAQLWMSRTTQSERPSLWTPSWGQTASTSALLYPSILQPTLAWGKQDTSNIKLKQAAGQVPIPVKSKGKGEVGLWAVTKILWATN